MKAWLQLFAVCLILFSAAADCREKKKSKAPHAATPSVTLLKNIDLPEYLKNDAAVENMPQPDLDKTAEQQPREGRLRLCLPPACDSDQTLSNSNKSGVANFSESMLAAKKREYGMGLSWAATSRLRLSAEYEKILYEGSSEIVSPDVIHAGMQWKF